MRLVGLLVGLSAAVVVAACLDAGMSPPTVDRTAGARPIAVARPAEQITVEVEPLEDEPAAVPAAEPPTPTPTPAPPVPVAITVEHLSPDGIAETCHLLAKFPFEPPDVTADPDTMRWYRQDDFDAIAKLCAMDFYDGTTTDTTTAVGVCPKLHWSTPALELFELDATKPDKDRWQKKQCPRYRHKSSPKLAKLKVPVYAKETESALLYFHFSRLLGNAALVYPATYRTVARKELVRWSRAAVDYISKLTTTATPLQGWQVLIHRHTKSTNPDVVGGSLAKNPRGESSHHAFLYYPGQKRRISTPADFRTRPYYKLVNSAKPIADQLGFDVGDPEEYREDVQALAYAQDFTNLVIMDSLFNARDRAGNIHSRNYHHFVDDAGHLRWKQTDATTTAKVTIELERLILKDNDDGLLWNMFGKLNSSPLVGDIHHLDSTMYLRMQWLAKLMEDPASADVIRRYFVDAVHIRATTYDDVEKRFLDLAERYRRMYDAGKLDLDLDLDAVIANAPPLPPAEPAPARTASHGHHHHHREKVTAAQK